jgi:hypothetical protein
MMHNTTMCQLKERKKKKLKTKIELMYIPVDMTTVEIPTVTTAILQFYF